MTRSRSELEQKYNRAAACMGKMPVRGRALDMVLDTVLLTVDQLRNHTGYRMDKATVRDMELLMGKTVDCLIVMDKASAMEKRLERASLLALRKVWEKVLLMEQVRETQPDSLRVIRYLFLSHKTKELQRPVLCRRMYPQAPVCPIQYLKVRAFRTHTRIPMEKASPSHREYRMERVHRSHMESPKAKAIRSLFQMEPDRAGVNLTVYLKERVTVKVMEEVLVIQLDQRADIPRVPAAAWDFLQALGITSPTSGWISR